MGKLMYSFLKLISLLIDELRIIFTCTMLKEILSIAAVLAPER